ncbi:hypothetical protein [Nocardia sp. NPDC049149]|uniref:hypothetical protein n=1 Tax=Nocardia sp. NPDC049149 TaxID=3364315 RepID=UPI003719F605
MDAANRVNRSWSMVARIAVVVALAAAPITVAASAHAEPIVIEPMAIEPVVVEPEQAGATHEIQRPGPWYPLRPPWWGGGYPGGWYGGYPGGWYGGYPGGYSSWWSGSAY